MKTCLVILLICSFKNGIYGTSLHEKRCAKDVWFTDTIPGWVKKIYEVNNDEFPIGAIPSVVFFKKLSDSTSYCLYEINDGVCQVAYVATQKNKRSYKKYKIETDCDADLSIPEYSNTSFKHDSVNRIIRSTTNTEKAKSKYLQKEGSFMRFKEGYDLENAETTKTTRTVIITINRNGTTTIRNQ